MATIKFKNSTHNAVKAAFVRKKTFKIVLFALGLNLLVSAWSVYRLYVLGDLNAIISKSNNYYNTIHAFIKGLF